MRRWYVVDADGAVLGRLASEVAKILRGKHKPIFSPHADTGDHVVVVNARSVRVTGGKETEKTYYRHSGYPGGLREIGYERLLAERPVLAVEKAIRGMLPKNRLGRQMFRKLSVYEGPEHPHQAQQPSALGLGEVPKWGGLPERAAPPPPKLARGDKARGTGTSVAASDERPGRSKPAKRVSATRTAAKSASARSSAAKRGSARGSAPKSSTKKSRATTRRAASAGAKSKKSADPKSSSSSRRPKAKKES